MAAEATAADGVNDEALERIWTWSSGKAWP